VKFPVAVQFGIGLAVDDASGAPLPASAFPFTTKL
jgi:hypothetical protein